MLSSMVGTQCTSKSGSGVIFVRPLAPPQPHRSRGCGGGSHVAATAATARGQRRLQSNVIVPFTDAALEGIPHGAVCAAALAFEGPSRRPLRSLPARIGNSGHSSAAEYSQVWPASFTAVPTRTHTCAHNAYTHG